MNKLLLIGGISLLLGIIHNILFFDANFGLNFPLFVGIILLCGGIIGYRSGARIGKTEGILIALAVFFATMVFIRSSVLLTFFNVVGCSLLLLILAETLFGKKLQQYLPGNYMQIFLLPFKFVPSFFEFVSDFFKFRKSNNSDPRTREIWRGIGMAAIALGIFTILFASADLVFGRFIKDLFSFNIDPEFLGRGVLALIVAALFMGAFGYMVRSRDIENDSGVIKKDRILGSIETTILFSSINLLFFGFIMLQIKYLFGGESHILAQGLTYADYARKGFFELILVAILSYIIISFVEKFVVKKERAHFGLFKMLSTILIVQVIAILISAFARLSIYEHAYGFTTIRLYSHALMIWMSLIFILLAYHIVTHGDRKNFALKAFACVILLLLAMNIINPDAFIAQRNLERYRETGKLDISYIAHLSYDAIPHTIYLAEDINEEVRNEYAKELYDSFVIRGFGGDRNDLEDMDWRSSELMRFKARELIKPYLRVLNEGIIREYLHH